MTFIPPNLFITDKQRVVNDPNRLPVAFRSIERYMNGLRIPTGGGGGGAYASLTGPGETTTPGDLTQAGGFAVNAPDPSNIYLTSNVATSGFVGVMIRDMGVGDVDVQSFGGRLNLDSGGNGIVMNNTSSTTGTLLTDSSRSGISIQSNTTAFTSGTIHGIAIQNTGLGGAYFQDVPAPGTTHTDGILIQQLGDGGISILNTKSSIDISTSAAGQFNPINLNAGAGQISLFSSTNQITLNAGGQLNLESGNVIIGIASGAQQILVETVASTGTDGIIIGSDAVHSKLNFFNSLLPVGQITCTGSKAGNAALASIASALAAYGLIINNTT